MPVKPELKNVKLIYFIDDDEEDALLFDSVVQSLNPSIRFVAFTHGHEALKALSTGREMPDVIFLDINMPLINGFECLTFLKTHPPLKSIPVIMFTTSRREKDLETCLSLGADYYVTKPNSYMELDQIVREFFSAPSPNRLDQAGA
jgi:CheY-like chemotaxis protein